MFCFVNTLYSICFDMLFLERRSIRNNLFISQGWGKVYILFLSKAPLVGLRMLLLYASGIYIEGIIHKWIFKLGLLTSNHSNFENASFLIFSILLVCLCHFVSNDLVSYDNTNTWSGYFLIIGWLVPVSDNRNWLELVLNNYSYDLSCLSAFMAFLSTSFFLLVFNDKGEFDPNNRLLNREK